MYRECDNICRLCDKLVFSNSVTVITVDGTDTLVIDIPQRAYNDGCKYCLVITQAIPLTATIMMPVAISIGGVTTTVYPLTTCNCKQVVACQIRTRTRYAVRVGTTATSGVFRVLGRLSCPPDYSLASLPIATTPAPATPAVANVAARSVASAPKKASAKTVDNMTVQANTVTVSKEDK